MKKAVLLSVALSFVLSGCWDLKSVQEINYATALGIDYIDGKYCVYTQLVNFASTSKQEGSNVTKAQQWIGTGRGESVLEAVSEMYKASQQPTMWSHLKVVVLSERVLEIGVHELKDSVFRFREIRYAPWVYGTKDPIDSLFALTGMFGKPALSTILEEPQGIVEQLTWFEPIRLQQLVYTSQEPAGTVMLPCITVSDRAWKKESKPVDMLTVSGAYALHKGKNQGYFPDKTLQGLIWMNRHVSRYSVAIKQGDRFVGTVSLSRPKANFIRRIDHGTPKLSISVTMDGYISELKNPIALDDLIMRARQTVEQDIRATFEHGVSKHADIYNLEEEIYRKDNETWKGWGKNENSPINANTLDKIAVRIKIKHSGTYRMNEPGVK